MEARGISVAAVREQLAKLGAVKLPDLPQSSFPTMKRWAEKWQTPPTDQELPDEVDERIAELGQKVQELGEQLQYSQTAIDAHIESDMQHEDPEFALSLRLETYQEKLAENPEAGKVEQLAMD
jgi:DNA-binding transcriptional MerR regulator